MEHKQLVVREILVNRFGNTVNTISGTAYYQYNGPSDAKPMRTPLTQEEVHHALELLNSDLTHAFPQPSTNIKTSEPDLENMRVHFSVEARGEREEILSVIEKVLGKADLYGELD